MLREPHSMNKNKKPVLIVGALAVVIASGFFVKDWLAHRQDNDELVLHGNVDIRDVTLAFRTGGRIKEVLKTEGDLVKKNEIVARLDPAPYELALAQTRAAVEVAKAQLKRVESGARREDISEARARLSEQNAAHARAQSTFERTERLAKSGAMTEQALVDARAAAAQTKAGVAAAQAAVARLVNGARSEEILVAHAQELQAETAVASAELNLKDTELKASEAGVVVTRAVEPGAMVTPGSPVMVVAFNDPVWIRAFAPEAQLAELAPGTQVEVLTDSRPNKPYKGQVGYVATQAEFTPKNVETAELRSSLVYRFRVIVREHDGGLRQGMPVRVKLVPSAP